MKWFILYQTVNNCIGLSGRWVPGVSMGLHCDQPAPWPQNASTASNPRNSAMSPTEGHPDTRHTVITVERGRKREGYWEGSRKMRQALPLKNSCLKQRPHNALPNVVPNSRYAETARPTWACARMPETADRQSNRSIMDPDAREKQHLFVVN